MAKSGTQADISIFWDKVNNKFVAGCIHHSEGGGGYTIYPHIKKPDLDSICIYTNQELNQYDLYEVMFRFDDVQKSLINMKSFSLNDINHYPPDFFEIREMAERYDRKAIDVVDLEDVEVDPIGSGDARNFHCDDNWIHFGNVIMTGERHSFFEKACRRADALTFARQSVYTDLREEQQKRLNVPSPPPQEQWRADIDYASKPETKSEEIVMTAESAVAPRPRRNSKQVLEQVAHVAQQSAKLKLQKDTGEAAIEITISRISKLLPEPAHKQFEVYINNDLGKAAVAYLLLAAQLAFMPDNKRLEYISTGAVIATTDAVGDMLPIKQMVIDLFSSLPVPPEASE